MMWTLDPKNEWEKRWELENPEPYIKPDGYDDRGIICWTWRAAIERIVWHKKRWASFQEWPVYKAHGKQYQDVTDEVALGG